MKKTTMNRILALVLLFTGLSFQAFAQPASVTVDGEDLARHGYNSNGDMVASENTDSVTVGAALKYYVLPDADANPTFNVASPLANVVSIFNWSSSVVSGTPGVTINAIGTNPQNYKELVFGAGTGVLRVAIKEQVSGGCESTDATELDIQVIAAPTFTFDAATIDGICIDGTDGSLTQTLSSIPITTSSEVIAQKELTVTYDITCNNVSFTALTDQTATVNTAGTGFSLPADVFTHSVKSNVNGVIGATGAMTYAISRRPVTGPVYHLPNL
jgi:hypothetical protein